MRPSRRSTRPSSSATAARSRPGWLRRTAAWSAGSRRLPTPSAVAEELYLSLYTRRPTDEERAEVARYLADRGKERVPALQELAWALLASTEFRFNH